ncbi:CBS domain-containing protein [Aquibacillus salsiterrae]|uniref:CBS domain-containing protein n=1 Tax=Aquibacillus salsiterrae TaxID=2950439 RepID=A0A9X4AHS0_9BACI|nr:CBS domain-containing protein [Aquibacillus salsiterrae]MDC3418630.1 CBS domain-containing protein [Aquibacillus salsiterrae]
MQANDIMKKQVIKVKDTAYVRDVIRKFIEHGISGLPIVNDRNEIVGYISDGDVMRFIGKHKDYIIDMYAFVNVISGDDSAFEEKAKRILDLNVLEIAKKKVVKVDYEADIEDVAAILGKKQIKKLPVERNGVLVGIISRGDVIRHSFEALL